MMVPLTALWLPILLSAVAVFIGSSLIHMVLRWHNSDFKKLPDEDGIRSTMREAGLDAGTYFFPCHEDPSKNMSPEMQEKFAEGPSGRMVVFPKGAINMGQRMLHWFFYCVVVNLVAGYMAAATLAPGTDYLSVFQIVGTAAFLGYAGGVWQEVIWWGAAPSAAIKSIADGLIYALLTAGVFGWLWP
ncbi:MAG: hypothetical protein GKS06_05935 [Acidobacteria bacterium]|nr:hypothetical protein [Acidobacteriota bacterium]